jgi:hypothetical protein
MSNGDYLTIEEVACKLGRMPSWVKEQICEGKIDATLSGNRWMIALRTLETLRGSSSSIEGSNTVHDFLPESPPKNRDETPRHQPSQRPVPPKPPHKSTASSRRKHFRKGKGTKPTLTQQIRKLDQKFYRLTTELKTAMLERQTPTKSGSKSKKADNLLREWTKVKAELQSLLRKAYAKGLTLPANLKIHEILDQKSRTANHSSSKENKRTRLKPPVVIKGIDEYHGGPRHAKVQQASTRPAEIEAQLVILRSRSRAAAHDMQDRAKSSDAREAAGRRWADARREAEALERDLKNAQPLDKGS